MRVTTPSGTIPRQSSGQRRKGGPRIDAGIVAGNTYDKYGTRNPIARRLMSGFLQSFDELVEQTSARSAVEAGCGEGHLSIRLARTGMRVRGYDLSPMVVEEARAQAGKERVDAEFDVLSVYDLSPDAHAADLVVCCEVLEHLENPRKALQLLSMLARPWLLVSVPREPLWRCLNVARGKYISDLGNTAGHLNHWSRRGFQRFLGECVDVIDVRTPIPWTMALCRSRGADGN